VLVVEDDESVATFIRMTLEASDYEVLCCAEGADALERAVGWGPDLVLLDLGLPELDGLTVCRRLRADPVTAAVPVIVVTGQADPADKIAGLEAGADDYIVKPFDVVELLARVGTMLRRNADMRALSPLTGLPGNGRILAEINRRVKGSEPFAVCYCDLDRFKGFNDRYGFLRGDELITLLARLLQRAALAVGDPSPFVGHVGGDDFVVVCAPEQVEPLTRGVTEALDQRIQALYDQEDAAAGGIQVIDRQGNAYRQPFVSISIGVAVAGPRRFTDSREVVAVATEMKGVAKREEGSAVAVDRRRTQ
jgi:diguanylate cyclase (GGDEF)-like protein